MNRRFFFKSLTLKFKGLFVFGLFFSFFAKKESAQAKGIRELKLIDEQDTLAKAMGYRHLADKASLRTNKEAYCYNCSKYNLCIKGDRDCKILSSKRLKEETEAPCQIFKGKTVAKMGWCLSWQVKAESSKR